MQEVNERVLAEIARLRDENAELIGITSAYRLVTQAIVRSLLSINAIPNPSAFEGIVRQFAENFRSAESTNPLNKKLYVAAADECDSLITGWSAQAARPAFSVIYGGK